MNGFVEALIRECDAATAEVDGYVKTWLDESATPDERNRAFSWLVKHKALTWGKR